MTVGAVLCAVLILGCASIPIKKYYVLNYVPEALTERNYPGPYPFVVRLKEFDIEEAYARPQIVYRRNPYELQYYHYRVWAVKPTRMITDLVQKHLASASLVSAIIRRFDEGVKPQYELSGMIEAIEEYDSDETWFSHLAIRFRLRRLSDGALIYNRRFDHRKQVFANEPDFVIKEMSKIMNFIMNQVTHDLDVTLAREYGVRNEPEGPATAEPDSVTDIPQMWNE